MASASGGWRGAFNRALEWCPSMLGVIRVTAPLLVVATVSFWFYFHFALERTVVVDAETGALEIELEAELSGKAFRNVWICERRIPGADIGLEDEPPKPIGCPSHTHHLIGPERLATPILPAGAMLKIMARPEVFRIDVVSVPKRIDKDSDVGRLEGGALVLVGRDALDAFGTLPLSGKAEIGALFSDTDRLSITSGNYRIRGYTPVGLLGGETRELRAGALFAGARARFIDRHGETATGHLAVMLPDQETSLMRVTAISEHATNNLAVRYYFTEEVVVRPSFLEALILDPLLQLLATLLGAVAGYGWLNRLLNFGDRASGP